MRVLHVLPRLANSFGPAHVLVNLSEQFARLGCLVRVYYLDHGDEPLLPEPSLFQTTSSPITFCRRWAYPKPLGMGLRVSVRELNVVHAHSAWMHPTLAAAHGPTVTNTSTSGA